MSLQTYDYKTNLILCCSKSLINLKVTCHFARLKFIGALFEKLSRCQLQFSFFQKCSKERQIFWISMQNNFRQSSILNKHHCINHFETRKENYDNKKMYFLCFIELQFISKYVIIILSFVSKSNYFFCYYTAIEIYFC